MEWQIHYYSEAVRLEINSWPVGLRAVYARITERMKIYGPNLGMPFTRALGQGLFEIRTKAKEGIGRAFFCTVVGRRIIILHSFLKQTQKTPLKELQLAQTRLKEIHNDNT